MSTVTGRNTNKPKANPQHHYVENISEVLVVAEGNLVKVLFKGADSFTKSAGYSEAGQLS
jgi:hypothetical protein